MEPPTRPLLDGLSAAGVQVLLPVARPGGELDWGRYDGWDRLAAGAVGGLLEPGTVAGPAALSAAEVIVVPALAADPHGGRLGRGAGYYDRALAGLTAPTLAVVFDDEVLTSVPVEAHDVAMSGVLTPSGLRWW